MAKNNVEERLATLEAQMAEVLAKVKNGIANGAALPAAVGHAKDDPDFDQYLDEIARYRREVEARECSSSSATPTT